MKELTIEWIEKAEEDFVVAKAGLMLKPQPNSSICFHCQQCLEKYLKSILQENGKRFAKTHNLKILQESCLEFLPKLSEYKDLLFLLNVYAVDTRYPGKKISDEETNQSIQTMEKIREIIRRYFSL